MRRQEVIVDDERMYALTRDAQGQLFIEVVCGGFAMENVVVPLNAAEEMEFKRRGKTYLDDLSLKVCKSPDAFKNRECS